MRFETWQSPKVHHYGAFISREPIIPTPISVGCPALPWTSWETSQWDTAFPARPYILRFASRDVISWTRPGPWQQNLRSWQAPTTRRSPAAGATTPACRSSQRRLHILVCARVYKESKLVFLL